MVLGKICVITYHQYNRLYELCQCLRIVVEDLDDVVRKPIRSDKDLGTVARKSGLVGCGLF